MSLAPPPFFQAADALRRAKFKVPGRRAHCDGKFFHVFCSSPFCITQPLLCCPAPPNTHRLLRPCVVPSSSSLAARRLLPAVTGASPPTAATTTCSGRRRDASSTAECTHRCVQHTAFVCVVTSVWGSNHAWMIECSRGCTA